MRNGARALWLVLSLCGCAHTATKPPASEPAATRAASSAPAPPAQSEKADTVPESWTALEDTLRALHRARKYDEAEQLLRGHMQQYPQNYVARRYFARFMFEDGRDAEALALLQAGVGLEAHDEVASLEIAIIHLERIGRGSHAIVTRTTQGYSGDPDWTESDEQAWKESELAAAGEALQRAVALAPDDAGVQYHLGRVLFERKDYPAAVAYYRRAAELAPDAIDVHRALAVTLAWAGQREAALLAMQDAAKLDPLNAEILSDCADLARQLGRPAEADALKERAELYAFLGPFAQVGDGDDMLLSVRALQGKAGDEELRKLMRRSDDAALRLLAALLWHHSWHAEEDALFATLGRAGSTGVPVLYQLAKNAQSICTMRGVVRTLVDERAPDVFDLLAQLLPQDTAPVFSIDVAPAMAKLGDARAAPLLIEFAHRAAPASDDLGGMAELSFELAQFRAVLALGAFDAPEVRSELQAWLIDDTLGNAAAAALFMQTHDAALLPRIAKALEAADLEAQYLFDPMRDANDKLQDRDLKRMLERYRRKEERASRQ